MKRIPVLATLVVAGAIVVLIGLGVWQIERAQWKDGLIARYSNASKLPPIAFPTAPSTGDPPLFRWATGNCLRAVGKREVAGENRQGDGGYVHIVKCATGAEGPGMAVELGWSKDPNARFDWPGGPVTGMIAPDRADGIRLVAATAPEGLEPSAVPTVEAIPQNHRMYAATWFAFALMALVIYILALRKRWRSE